MEERMEKATGVGERSQERISLDVLWPAVKHRWWVIVVVAIVTTALFYVNAVRTYTPQYQTSSTFTVSISNNYGSSTKTYNNATAKQMAKTFPYVLQSGVLGDMVAKDLGYPTLPGTVTASSLEETNLFTLTVTATEPQLAYDILQSVIRNYPQVAEFVVGPTELVLLDEDGVVTAPLNRVSLSEAIRWGVIVGLLAGIASMALYLMLHRTVRRVDDIKELSNAPCLAVVPQVSRKKRSRERRGMLITAKRVSRGFLEAIYRVRTGVENSGKQVFLVSSALPGEGKTTTAVNLALSLAKKDHRVVLIDADLRHPSVARQLGVPKSNDKGGLTAYLRGKLPLEQIGFTVSNMKNLVVLSGGEIAKNASELLGNSAMAELIEALRRQADYVIIDTPPCSTLADSAVVGQYVDGVVFVVRQDYASRDRVLRGIGNVATSGAPLVGCVLNAATFGMLDYGYGGYYYGRYGYGRYGYGYYGSRRD